MELRTYSRQHGSIEIQNLKSSRMLPQQKILLLKNELIQDELIGEVYSFDLSNKTKRN